MFEEKYNNLTGAEKENFQRIKYYTAENLGENVHRL